MKNEAMATLVGELTNVGLIGLVFLTLMISVLWWLGPGRSEKAMQAVHVLWFGALALAAAGYVSGSPTVLLLSGLASMAGLMGIALQVLVALKRKGEEAS